MNFREVVIESLDRLMGSDAIPKMIDERLAKTVKEVIEHELRGYGDFGKRIEEAVKKSLQLHGDLDLPSYNDAILKIVRRQVSAQMENLLQTQVAENMQRLLQTPPAEVKLSELIDEWVQQLQREQDGYGEFTFFYEESTSPAGYRRLYIDEDANTSKHSCDIQIAIDNEGKVYSLKLGKAEIEKQLFVGPIYGFEEKLFQMKVAGSKLIFDVAPADISTTFEPSYVD